MKVVAFSGLRDFPDIHRTRVSHEVRTWARGATELRFGGALGFDTLALNAVADLGIPCVVYVPFMLSDQPAAARAAIVESGARVVELGLPRGRGAYVRRTHRMLQDAHLLVAATDGRRTGGTHYAITYATRHQIRTHRILLGILARQTSMFREEESS